MNDPSAPETQPQFERTELAQLNEMRLKRASPKPDGRNAYEQLKVLVIERLSALIDAEPGSLDNAELRLFLLEKYGELLLEERIILNRSERRKLIEDVLSEVLGSDSETDVERSS